MIQLPRTTGTQIFLPVAATVITSLLIQQVFTRSSSKSSTSCSKQNANNSATTTNIYYYCYKYRSAIHRLQDGALYVGPMSEDKKLPHGEGIKIYSHKTDDDNDTVNDHGQFKYSFEGTFDQGTPTFGVYTYTDGTQLEGPVVRGKVHGQGRMTLADGTSYEGPFQYDTMFGPNGKLVYTDGREVSGHFVDGVLQGTGSVKTSSGDVITGEWNEGRPVGKMNIRYADGSLYEGEVKEEDKTYVKHGAGVYQTNYDTRWNGTWKDDVAHGSCVILQSNETSIKCDFWEGIECGNMVYASPDED